MCNFSVSDMLKPGSLPLKADQLNNAQVPPVIPVGGEGNTGGGAEELPDNLEVIDGVHKLNNQLEDRVNRTIALAVKSEANGGEGGVASNSTAKPKPVGRPVAITKPAGSMATTKKFRKGKGKRQENGGTGEEPVPHPDNNVVAGQVKSPVNNLDHAPAPDPLAGKVPLSSSRKSGADGGDPKASDKDAGPTSKSTAPSTSTTPATTTNKTAVKNSDVLGAIASSNSQPKLPGPDGKNENHGNSGDGNPISDQGKAVEDQVKAEVGTLTDTSGSQPPGNAGIQAKNVSDTRAVNSSGIAVGTNSSGNGRSPNQEPVDGGKAENMTPPPESSSSSVAATPTVAPQPAASGNEKVPSNEQGQQKSGGEPQPVVVSSKPVGAKNTLNQGNNAVEQPGNEVAKTKTKIAKRKFSYANLT